jgi:hypothetical protein
VQIVTEMMSTHLRLQGYFVTHVAVRPEEAVQSVLALARSLGELYVPAGCEPSEPIIRTAPSRAHQAAPFDRPEPIGWHGDFATYEDRPELSLVYVARADPRGGEFGAWRLASVERIINSLCATGVGRAAIEIFAEEPLPFSYRDDEPPRWFRVMEPKIGKIFGLRFYVPSLRRGCIAVYGEVPSRVAVALETLERAADDVGEIVPTREGSLLIASNWFALHDRVRQTISKRGPNREALLCFVARKNGCF